MLELLCPDGSALLVDESKTIGRASGEGGLKDVPQASRAHFSVAPIALLEGALSLKMVGQNCVPPPSGAQRLFGCIVQVRAGSNVA